MAILRLDIGSSAALTVTVDLDSGLVGGAAKAELLRPKELQALRHLARRRDEDVSRDELLVEVWQYSPSTRTRVVDVTLSNLRRKLEPAGACLQSIRAQGYRLTGVREEALLPAPTPDAELFGRGEALAFLDRWLAGNEPWLSVVGIGGVGKTALARALARRAEQAPRFSGVLWVDLSAQREEEEALLTVLQALGSVPSSQRGAEALLGRILFERRLLVILDNLESVLGLGAVFQRLCARDPGLGVVMTSRASLDFPGELLLRLGPLEPAAAASLLRQRLCHGRPAWIPDVEEEMAIAELAERLGGLPLGIALAAAVAQDQGLRAVIDGVGEQRGFAGSFGRTWASLPVGLRAPAAALSVLRGTFDEEAAAEVAGLSAAELDTLGGRSLLSCGEGGRWSLHPMLRTQLAARLEGRPAVQERHRRWFLGRLIELQASFVGPDQRAAVRAMAPLRADLLAAWDDAVLEGDWALLSRATTGFAAWAWARAESALVRRALLAAAQAAATFGRPEALRWEYIALQNPPRPDGADADWERLQVLGQAPGATAPGLRTERALALGRTAMDRGRAADAMSELDEALRHEVDPYHRARIVHQLSESGWRCDPAGILARLPELIEVARAARTPGYVVSLLMSWGTALYEQNQLEEARRLYAESVRLADRIENPSVALPALNGLGNIARLRGDSDTASRFYRECLTLSRRVGTTESTCVILNNLSLVERAAGHLAEARQGLEEGLRLSRHEGHRRAEHGALLGVGMVLGLEGELDRAFRMLDDAEALGRELGDEGARFLPSANRAVIAWLRLPRALARPHIERAWAERGLARVPDQGLLMGALSWWASDEAGPAEPLAWAAEPSLLVSSRLGALALLQRALRLRPQPELLALLDWFRQAAPVYEVLELCDQIDRETASDPRSTPPSPEQRAAARALDERAVRGQVLAALAGDEGPARR